MVVTGLAPYTLLAPAQPNVVQTCSEILPRSGVPQQREGPQASGLPRLAEGVLHREDGQLRQRRGPQIRDAPIQVAPEGATC